MRRLGLLAGWTLVLTLTTSLAWQIVSAADDRVSDRPVTPLNVEPPVVEVPASTTTTTVPEPVTTTRISPTTTTSVPTADSTVTTSTAPTPTAPTPTSSPTTVESAWSLRSINTSGGVVVVRYRPGEVELNSATPAAGFTTEVEEEGPPEVDVEFESDDGKVEIRVRWLNGELDISISESEDD